METPGGRGRTFPPPSRGVGGWRGWSIRVKENPRLTVPSMAVEGSDERDTKASEKPPPALDDCGARGRVVDRRLRRRRRDVDPRFTHAGRAAKLRRGDRTPRPDDERRRRRKARRPRELRRRRVLCLEADGRNPSGGAARRRHRDPELRRSEPRGGRGPDVPDDRDGRRRRRGGGGGRDRHGAGRQRCAERERGGRPHGGRRRLRDPRRRRKLGPRRWDAGFRVGADRRVADGDPQRRGHGPPDLLRAAARHADGPDLHPDGDRPGRGRRRAIR